MTANIVECISLVLKETRKIPITAFLKITYIQLLELFVRKDAYVKGSNYIRSNILQSSNKKNRETNMYVTFMFINLTAKKIFSW